MAKELSVILSELQAVDKTELDQVVSAHDAAVADLSEYIAAQTAAPAPVVATSVVISFSDGSTQSVPKV